MAGSFSFVAALGPVAGPAAAASPTASADTSVAAVGQLVHITGFGWSPVGGVVEVLICGNDALDYSADCDLTNTYGAAIRADGAFYAGLVVALPPTPCPCVLWVTTAIDSTGLTLPLSIAGAPTAPASSHVANLNSQRTVKLTATIHGSESWRGWFGLSQHRVLTLQVTNLFMSSLTNPVLSLTMGSGSNPTGYIQAPQLATLAAGSSETLTIPVKIPPLTIGHLSVEAQVQAGGPVATATVTTSSTFPWGLLILVVLLIQGILLLVRNVSRRRMRKRTMPPPDELEAEPESVVAATPVSSADLEVVAHGADGTVVVGDGSGRELADLYPELPPFLEAVGVRLDNLVTHGDVLAVMLVEVREAAGEGVGGDAPDEVRSAVGERLASEVRSTDTVARIGCHMFAVLFQVGRAEAAGPRLERKFEPKVAAVSTDTGVALMTRSAVVVAGAGALVGPDEIFRRTLERLAGNPYHSAGPHGEREPTRRVDPPVGSAMSEGKH